MKHQKLTMVAASVGLALSLTGCGGGGDEKSDAIKLPTVPTAPATKTIALDMMGGRVTVPLEFVDAKTGQPIIQPVILTASDDVSGNNVYESVELGKESPQDNGNAILFIKQDFAKTATATAPVKFRVVATADGYFDTSIDVIYDGGVLAAQQMSMVSKSAPPAGVAVAVQREVKADAVGTLSTALNLTATTTDAASKGAGATFSLPAGTVLKDRAGQPLTGDLQVSIGYFSPEAENLGDVFPGGLSPDTVAAFANGVSGVRERQSGYFITAGLLAVDIVDSQGRKAHQLENAKGTMTIQTPAGLINPETDQPIKAGDTVPVWSHNESTGLWTQERVGTFTQKADGNFEVTYEVNHLSYWNLDWHYSTKCPSLVMFTYSKPDEAKYYDGRRMDVQISGYGSYNNQWNTGQGGSSPAIEGLYNVPQDREVTFTFYDRGSDKIVAKGVKPLNSCATVNIQAIATPTIPREVPVQILLTAPQGFTKAQVQTLLNSMKSLTDAQRAAVLKYTHPTDANALFKMDQAAYLKLREQGLSFSNIATIQALLSVKVQAQGYFSGVTDPNRYYWSPLSSTGGMTLTLPSDRDTLFKGSELITYSYRDWWSGQTRTYSYTRSYARLYGSIRNQNGNWRYFNIPLKTPATISKDATQAAIVFEDIDAMQRVLSFINSQQQTPAR